ncbi:hypothetical protein KP509_18G042000 [Ceratopteris richardii]|uniref:F-box protein n=1 Tax=Ceratopteris richardii TaxID=49495 RepID=A0A8T2SP15_CERRI|nr:hypothetical protein KP509_18G042000 [Ceratopteris richardii]
MAHAILKHSKVSGLLGAACAGSLLNLVSSSEKIWERVCNQHWPSTRDPEWFDDEQDMVEELLDTSLNDFMFIVNLIFRDRPIISQVLHGIPGTGAVHGWFSNYPFRIDLINQCYEEGETEDLSEMEACTDRNAMIIDGLPLVLSIEKERKDGHVWKALCEDINLSWILIKKKTKQMANLASWRPLGGQRHWPGDKDFLVLFGSVLPAHRLLASRVVQCSVVLKCRLLLNSDRVEKGERISSLMVTELSMQLEDTAGMPLKGLHSLLVLKEVLGSSKSMNHPNLLKVYGQYVKAQSELKDRKHRIGGHVDVTYVIGGILSLLSLCYFML